MGVIWVIVDHRHQKMHPVSIELIALAQQLAERQGHTVWAVIAGDGVDPIIDALQSYDISRIVALEDPRLQYLSAMPYLDAWQFLARSTESPVWVLYPHTYRYFDIGARLGVMFQTEPVSDVQGVVWADTTPIWVKPVFAGKFVARIRLQGTGPFVVGIQPGAISTDQVRTGGSPEVVRMHPEIRRAGQRRLIRSIAAERGRVDLANAPIIVAVGRGIGSKEKLAIVEELARELDAAIGASRPVVDAGWLPFEHQIGSSGQTVAPKLYIAIGISGAMQHVVGMKNAKVIVAINKDPEAPIFKIAHYGIVDDLFKVVPILTQKIREWKETGRL